MFTTGSDVKDLHIERNSIYFAQVAEFDSMLARRDRTLLRVERLVGALAKEVAALKRIDAALDEHIRHAIAIELADTGITSTGPAASLKNAAGTAKLRAHLCHTPRLEDEATAA